MLVSNPRTGSGLVAKLSSCFARASCDRWRSSSQRPGKRQEARRGARMVLMADDITSATDLIVSLAPGGFPCPIRVPLAEDECRWFLRAVEGDVIRFRQ